MPAEVKVVKAAADDQGWMGGFGARFLVRGEDSDGRFGIVEHPLKPKALAAPLHRHSREDEYSYVVRGRIGAELGGRVVFGGPGDVIYKPRGEWHTFWNATTEEASLLEVISPGGFERYFEELLRLFHEGKLDPGRIGAIAQRYGLEIDPSTIGPLCARHGLTFS